VRASESALKSHLSGSEFGVRASACIDDKPLCCMAAADPDLIGQVASSACHQQLNKHIHIPSKCHILASMYSRNTAFNRVSC